MGQDRRTDGTHRFVSRYSDEDLDHIATEIVASIIRQGHHPDDISAAMFDAALAGSKWPTAPKADRFAKRFGMPFSRVVAVAADPRRSLARQRALAGRQKAAELPVIAESVFALRLVADHLATDRINRRIYRTGRTSLISTTPKRRRRDIERSLPTDDAVYVAYGSFEAAVRAAGLVHEDGVAARRGMPVIEAIEAFFIDVGCLPWNVECLEEYGRQRDVGIESVKNLTRHREEFIQSWRSQGRWAPAKPPPRKKHRPPLQVEPRPDPRYPRANRHRWEDPDRLIEGLAKAYRIAREHNVRLNQDYHQALSVAHSDIPSQNTVDRKAKDWNTTAKKLREKAHRLSLAESR